VWVIIALAVAIPGFALARRLSREHYEMAGIAVAAMLEVLISPVAWIHYFLMVIIAIGVIAGDGRQPRRLLTAAGAAVFFGLTIPWWGHSLLSDPDVPRLLSRVVEDAFGIAAAALIIIIARMRKTGADRDRPGSGHRGRRADRRL
jgi:alpha-1,2-mannosyltransferase